jgi:myb proto-oncogene protein
MELSVEGATFRKDTLTTDDDNKLKDAVEKHGAENWKVIATLLPSRTKIQCWSIWHFAVNPSIDRTALLTGCWTKDEDNKLKKAAEKYGRQNWDAVAALVRSRTISQCLCRWHDTLDPSIDPPTGHTN